MENDARVDGAVTSVKETVAAQMMWDFYKLNKADLIPDIRQYRDYILERLMLGHNVEQVFGQFMRVIEPVSVPCKSTNGRKRSPACKQTRKPWPFTT